jgi:Ser/Thr protein kinase RdoA (MazF antagonist)
VTAKTPRLTPLPDGLLDALERRYSLGTLGSVERLTGGYANDVFRVRSAAGPVVLRVKYPPVDPASIRWEHDLLALLAERVAEVPAPLAARDGTTFFRHGRFAVWLLRDLPGTPVRADDPRHAEEAARLLARVHSAGTAGLAPRPRHPRLRDLPFPEAAALPPELTQWLPRLREFRAEAIRFVRDLGDAGRALTTGVVHGDVFPGNVLVHEERASALLDWEEADLDWQAYDLAVSAWSFSRTGADLDRSALARFVAAYRAGGGPVPPAEDELLVPFIRVKRVLEVLRAPTDRHVDWDDQLENLRAAERLR